MRLLPPGVSLVVMQMLHDPVRLVRTVKAMVG
jgi:hypothetical protein